MTPSLRRRVMFIGGARRFPSVQIRCVQIARALGCDYTVTERECSPPPEKDLFILVKYQGLRKPLSARGKVVWDVIDDVPPLEDIGVYLCSTEVARKALVPAIVGRKRIAVIPHHHCNFEGRIRTTQRRKRIVWIGTTHWRPRLDTLRFATVDTSRLSPSEVRRAYLKADILLNLRRDETLNSSRHIMLNSGLKLINALGFGIPSVSSPEPAYYEIGADCTLFATPAEVAEKARMLRRDERLYAELRERALARSERFGIQTIVRQYQSLLSEVIES